MPIDRKDLYRWCAIPHEQLEGHPGLKIPVRLVRDSAEMGRVMAREPADEIRVFGERGESFRAIIPCGPSCWYAPFTDLVDRENLSLRHMTVFHMDECLDWQDHELPRSHPYSFRGFMEHHFYGPVREELSVPEQNRCWPRVDNIDEIERAIAAAPIRLTYGGWGQDGHIAYNQARRHPYHAISLDELRKAGMRVQENNWDTVLALSQRTFGTAYQFVPPMSITLGLKQCLSAARVRLFSDTGAWKQTALRVALFSEPTPEYPMTLLQEHPDVLLTATVETADHPISRHPEWDLGV